MRVVMLGQYPTDPTKIVGGVQAVVRYLTTGLQHFHDLEVDLITLSGRGSQKKSVKHGNVAVHYLPISSLPSYLSIVANIQQLKTITRQLKPDIVHAQVAGEYAVAASRTGLPWVLTLHGIRFLEVNLWQNLISKYYRGMFIKLEERYAIKHARHIISISPYIEKTFNGDLQGKVYDIENPVDDVFFQVSPQRVPGQMLFIGNLIPRKGVYTLLQAFAEVYKRCPSARLRIAGDNVSSSDRHDYPSLLKQFVAEAGLEEAVTFLGVVKKPALLKEYANSSLVVLPALQETAPMVIMEAMAAGRAVVGTDVGGVSHLIAHGKTGLVVPPDNVPALSEALYDVISDEAKLDAMGSQGHQVALARFHANVVATKTRQVYYDVLGQTAPS